MGLLFKTPQEQNRRAAKDAEKRLDWILAWEQWTAAGDEQQASSAWNHASDVERARACDARGRFLEAGEYWERGRVYKQAAESFERGMDQQRAAANWEKAEQWSRAADCYTAIQEPERAAALYEQAGAPLPAAMRWHEAGRREQALEALYRCRDGLSDREAQTQQHFLPLLAQCWTSDFARTFQNMLDAPATGPWKTLHAAAQAQLKSVPASLSLAVALRAGVVDFVPRWCRSVFESGAPPNNEVHSVLAAWLMRQTARSPDTATVHLGAAWLAAWEGDADAVSRHVRASISADPARLDDALALLRTVADHLGKGRNGAYLAERIRLAVESL